MVLFANKSKKITFNCNVAKGKNICAVLFRGMCLSVGIHFSVLEKLP